MRLLIADDHVLLRDALRYFIKVLRNDWAIEAVGDFYAVYQQLKNGERYDLILMDLRMPGMKGMESLKTIIKEFPDQKISIFTGVAEEYFVKEALACGVAAYFPKTLRGRALIEAIEDVVLIGDVYLPHEVDDTMIFLLR